MSEVPTQERLATLGKDALYVAVGLAVITVQRLQVRRQELQKQLDAQLGDARSQVQQASKRFDARVKTVEERLEAIESQIDALLDQVEARLPDQAREVSKQARTAAKDARSQVRGLVRSTTSSAA